MIIRDGERYDLFGCNSDTCIAGPGLFYVGEGDIAIFLLGYDCLFSISADHPESCGYSTEWQNFKTSLAAVTDVHGALITSANPLRQGQTVTLWMTGLRGLTRDTATGLLQQTVPTKLDFGVSKYGGPTSFPWSQQPQWAGEAPQYVGLDLVNITIPSCRTRPSATVEKRYDLFLQFRSVTDISGSSIQVKMPLLIEPGDPDCLG